MSAQIWLAFEQLLNVIFPWRQQISSRVAAKQRLKVVIAHDRSGLTSQALEAMRQEILAVVARYVEIDPTGSEFSLAADDRMTALIANLPIRRIKDPDEVDFFEEIPTKTEEQSPNHPTEAPTSAPETFSQTEEK